MACSLPVRNFTTFSLAMRYGDTANFEVCNKLSLLSERCFNVKLREILEKSSF